MIGLRQKNTATNFKKIRMSSGICAKFPLSGKATNQEKNFSLGMKNFSSVFWSGTISDV